MLEIWVNHVLITLAWGPRGYLMEGGAVRPQREKVTQAEW